MGLEALIRQSNANNVARVANSQLSTNDEKLQPMKSLKTGKSIEKFPATSAGIAKLSCKFCSPYCIGLRRDLMV